MADEVAIRGYHRAGYRKDFREDPEHQDTCELYVGRLIIRPAKLTPQGFSPLDPLVIESREKDKIVLRAKSGRDRGYFANGLVALSTSEAIRGLAILTDKAGWRDDWCCVEITYVSDRFVKAIIASQITFETLELYYRWVADHPESKDTIENWLAVHK